MLVISLMLIYICFLLYILKKEPLAIIGFFFIIFPQTTNLISTVYLDQGGVYMRELEIFSERSYTSVIVFLFNIIAILVIFILLRMKKITLRNLLPHVNQKRVANITTS